MLRQIVGQNFLRSDGVSRRRTKRGVELGELVAVRILRAGFRQGARCFRRLTRILERKNRQTFGAGPGAYILAEYVEPLHPRLLIAQTKVDLSQAELQSRGDRTALWHGLEELVAGSLPSLGRVLSLERFAAQQ